MLSHSIIPQLVLIYFKRLCNIYYFTKSTINESKANSETKCVITLTIEFKTAYFYEIGC